MNSPPEEEGICRPAPFVLVSHTRHAAHRFSAMSLRIPKRSFGLVPPTAQEVSEEFVCLHGTRRALCSGRIINNGSAKRTPRVDTRHSQLFSQESGRGLEESRLIQILVHIFVPSFLLFSFLHHVSNYFMATALRKFVRGVGGLSQNWESRIKSKNCASMS